MPPLLHGCLPSGFLILPENRSAVQAVHTITQAALAEKRTPFCPLLLHGPTGAGKTSLVSGAVRELATAGSSVTIRTVSAIEFARPDEADGRSDPGLHTCDVLIVEDIQHLPARVADLVCNLIDRRIGRRKALVLTTTIGPAGLTHLPRRLTSRLAGGLLVQLEPYGPDSRRAILEAAAIPANLRLTPDALTWLARESESVRSALGCVSSLAQLRPGSPDALDKATVERLLAGAGRPRAARGAQQIVRRVASAFGVSEKELLGDSRLRTVLLPRQVAMYLTRELTDLSLPKIGSVFANRDHTTVLHACRKVEQQLAADNSLKALMRQMRQELS